MSYILRGIGRKTLWTKSGHPDFPWLQEGELLADVFNEIRTKDGKLSIYTVDTDKTNLTRIIVALASGRENFQDYDYVVVPKREIEEKFEINKIKGETADDCVNKWHLDLVQLTPSKLTQLAYIFCDHRESMSKLPKKKVRSEIRKGIDSGLIDQTLINQKLKAKLSTVSTSTS